MKLPSKIPAIILVFLGLSPLPMPGARAQDTDSLRVVRLSLAEGQVLVSHPGSDGWEEASVNLPLQEGDSLATQGGLAEIEFENGATAYLAENSTLLVTQLGFADGGGRATELSMTQGAGTFYANLTSRDSFRVRTSTFDVVIPERSEFRVDSFHDGAAVEVFLGTVAVSTTKGSTTLTKGESVAVHDRDFRDLNIARLPEQDEFDRWVSEQSEIIQSGTKNTLGYISSPNYYGLSDLAIYGTWVNIPSFGLSWRPFSAGFSWTPYSNGRWILDPHLGWIWISNEAWGWMPYHFGTWLLSPTLGWVWVPGGPAGLRRWEGACVNWVHFGNQVGWVAKSPEDRNGALANLSAGLVTRPVQPRGNGNEGNEIVTSKELRGATVLKEPPREFDSRVAPASAHSGISSTIRREPRSANETESIVFDRGTRTFVNREDSRPDYNKRATAPPAGLAPQTRAEDSIPRVTIPPTMPVQALPNRVLLPSPHPATMPTPGAAATNGSQRVQPLVNAPRTAQTPAAAAPRQTTPPAAPSQPPASHNPPAHPGSAARSPAP